MSNSKKVQLMLNLDNDDHRRLYERLTSGYTVANEARALLLLGFQAEQTGARPTAQPVAVEQQPVVDSNPVQPAQPVEPASDPDYDSQDLIQIDFMSDDDE